MPLERDLYKPLPHKINAKGRSSWKIESSSMMQQLNASPFDGWLRSGRFKLSITVIGVIVSSIALVLVVSSSLIANIPAVLMLSQTKLNDLSPRVAINLPNSTLIATNEVLPKLQSQKTETTNNIIAFQEGPTVSIINKSQPSGFARTSAHIRRVLHAIRSIFIALFNKLCRLRFHLISPASTSSSPSDPLAFNNPNPFRDSSGVINDHLETDVNLLPITTEQRERLLTTYTQILEAIKLNPELYGSQPAITPHGVYRYYAASDWQPKYDSRSYLDSILATLRYRYSEYLDARPSYFASSSPSSSPEMIYVSPAADKQQRAVLYLRVARYDSNAAKSPASAAEMIRMVAMAVERACRQSDIFQSGTFITIVDMRGFQFSRAPPLSFVTEAMSLLKQHYPYRVDGIAIVNAPAAFSFAWRLVKPFVPKKVLAKTHVLSVEQTKLFLQERIETKNLEREYGGRDYA